MSVHQLCVGPNGEAGNSHRNNEIEGIDAGEAFRQESTVCLPREALSKHGTIGQCHDKAAEYKEKVHREIAVAKEYRQPVITARLVNVEDRDKKGGDSP